MCLITFNGEQIVFWLRDDTAYLTNVVIITYLASGTEDNVNV